jgi:hypothetical protein
VIEGELGEVRALSKLQEEQLKALKNEVRQGKRRDGHHSELESKVRDLESALLQQRQSTHQQTT